MVVNAKALMCAPSIFKLQVTSLSFGILSGAGCFSSFHATLLAVGQNHFDNIASTDAQRPVALNALWFPHSPTHVSHYQAAQSFSSVLHALRSQLLPSMGHLML